MRYRNLKQRTPIDVLLDQVDWTPIDSHLPDEERHATHSGILNIDGFELRVFQLNDGQRIILKEDFERFFGMALES